MFPCGDDYCAKISEYTEQLVRSKGYPLEIYEVTTEDGYILSLYRIPHSPINVESCKKKYPVLIVHGFLASMADSIFEDRQLGYFLSENGFDVWIANCRGTTYSRGHKKYHHVKDKADYWDFSFHELGFYDIPAFIDCIKEKTNSSKLFYVGFSQGAAVFSVMMSTRPKYNQNVALAFLICPAIIETAHASYFPLRMACSHLMPMAKWLSSTFNLYFHECPMIYFFRLLGRNFVKENTFAEVIFQRCYDFFGGHRNPYKNYKIDFAKTSIATPNTASWKQVQHFAQVIAENRFAHYDYGEPANMRIYNTKQPPSYDLSRITCPVALFYSNNDLHYGIQDMEQLSKKLGNCVYTQLTGDKYFNHIDFFFNADVTQLVHLPVLKLMMEYNK